MSQKAQLFSALLLIGLLSLASPAFAVHPDERGEIENLRKRIEALEAEKGKPAAPLLIEALAKKLRFSGLLELEGFYADTEGGTKRATWLSPLPSLRSRRPSTTTLAAISSCCTRRAPRNRWPSMRR